jgi:N6-adenosine-specific RNA methylase IME4
MTMELSAISRKHVPTVQAALKALANMERELSQASTYAEIRKVIDAGNALKLLFNDVDLVKAEAEDVILAAAARIGEEIAKVPKGRGPGRAKIAITAQGKSNRKDAMPSGTSRARYQKLAAAKPKLKAIAKKLREQGKDATPTAVVRELTQGDKKTARTQREKALGAKQLALPDKRYGVIVADPEWNDTVWSEETGMDRHASNHYPTSDPSVIASRPVASIAAKDAVLFLWTTNQHLRIAIGVLESWGFEYKSNYIWGKDHISTGRWNRSKHEILLIGTHGKVPCPAPGTQWDSLIMAPKGKHSEKPECFLEMVEQYYPTMPKIELNRRGAPRPGWDAWGNEAQQAQAAE